MNQTRTHLGDTPFVKKLNLFGLGAAGLGIVLSIIAVMTNMERFLFSYLLAFVFVGGIAITGVFFSMLQYLVRAGWSVTVRRIPEFIGSFVPFLLLLMIPIALGVGTIFHHWVYPEAGDLVLAGKTSWLSLPFFFIRLGVYYLIWLGLYFFIVGNSFRQDKTTDTAPTERNWKFSAPATILYGVTMTFVAFDLIMSLYPHWFSTIFGVYYFAGSLVGTLAVVTIIAIALRNAGLLEGWITTEHFHDLGKLLFAFNVFWAYIAFSQYLLIWYANLPEEIIFFAWRVEHGWQYVSAAILVVHFLVPFFLLLSQDAKKNLNRLLTGAIILLVGHFIDMYWLVMPNYTHESVPFGWIELAPTIAIAGLLLLVIAWQCKKRSAVPINDPFLPEAVH